MEMKRAISVNELLAMRKETLAFEGEWKAAFGEPERYGVWFVWGRSGSGKTSFTLQLCKELCRFGRVAYDSLEEGVGLTMQNAFARYGMKDVARRLVLLDGEKVDELDRRLDRRKSPDFLVVDSFQYLRIGYQRFQRFKEAHPDKLLVFVSQASGTQPKGRPADSVMYDASLKIWVEGYRAFSKGRFFGERGYYTVWPERAALYWGGTAEPGAKNEQ